MSTGQDQQRGRAEEEYWRGKEEYQRWAASGEPAQGQERDLTEEAYWRRFCVPCGASPCTWDGEPDGFHADEEPDPDSLTARLTDRLADQITVGICIEAFGTRHGISARSLRLAEEAVLGTSAIAGGPCAMYPEDTR